MRAVDPNASHSAVAMVAAADLDWTVEQRPREAVVEREHQSLRVAVPRHMANVRSDTRAVLGVVGKGYGRYYDELEEIGGRLISERMDESEFERFLARLVPLPEPRPDRTEGGRAVRNAERVREAIQLPARLRPIFFASSGVPLPARANADGRAPYR